MVLALQKITPWWEQWPWEQGTVWSDRRYNCPRWLVMLWGPVVSYPFIFTYLCILHSLNKPLPSNHGMQHVICCSGVHKNELDKIMCTKILYWLIRRKTQVLEIFCCSSRSVIHLLHSVLWPTKFAFDELQYWRISLQNVCSTGRPLYH